MKALVYSIIEKQTASGDAPDNYMLDSVQQTPYRNCIAMDRNL